MKMLLYYGLSFLIIVIDQITKFLVVQNMDIAESREIIPDFFYLTSHRNSGAAFGILQGQMWLFYIVTVIVVIAIVYHLHKYGRDSKWYGIPLALILGGAIGNFIDRLLFGEVVDFFNVYIFNYNYPIFNIADSALVVGVILLIIKMAALEWQEKRKNKA
ncbi:lipoprotein signal peptidase [Salibacterium salarium]|uniref:Lipoprotein signal peptidase n=2 Tax=Salibacterium salarium TaxID=284579 RepID=A0A428MYT2_9BACI|nr:lipoprotein signal peptidase [Salibacterium salarium]